MKSTIQKQWIDEFILELRLREVRGDAIGDAVASVRELLADSGQDPVTAFGHPREYAKGLDLPLVAPSGRTTVADVLGPAISVLAALIYIPAVYAHFSAEMLGYSLPQLLLMLVPLLAVLGLPIYFNQAIRHIWILLGVLGLSVVATAAASFLAPREAEQAWLLLKPLTVCIVSGLVLIISSVAGAIATWRAPEDPIIDPLAAPKPTSPAGRAVQAALPALLMPLAAMVTTLIAWISS